MTCQSLKEHLLMKKGAKSWPAVSILILVSFCSSAQSPVRSDPFDADSLFAHVEKFTSFGIHRTGTAGDNATSQWLSRELTSYGFSVRYLDFPLTQFFLDSAFVRVGENKISAFPLWYVNKSVNSATSGVLIDGNLPVSSFRNKIAYLRIKITDHVADADRARFKELISAGVTGIVACTESITGEIVASNTPEDHSAWPVPIVFIGAGDSARLMASLGKNVAISVSGKFQKVSARNVYGTVGSGSRYVVISTPISGWFSCGGERGPGIAAWLALAKWVSSAKLPYRFIFTANSGHELYGIGAHAFLDRVAPPASQTALWVHLGAGIATLSWKQTPAGLQKTKQSRFLAYHYLHFLIGRCLRCCF